MSDGTPANVPFMGPLCLPHFYKISVDLVRTTSITYLYLWFRPHWANSSSVSTADFGNEFNYSEVNKGRARHLSK